jgi:hypothetical protein
MVKALGALSTMDWCCIDAPTEPPAATAPADYETSETKKLHVDSIGGNSSLPESGICRILRQLGQLNCIVDVKQGINTIKESAGTGRYTTWLSGTIATQVC